jgi:acyl carrier protein
MSVTAAPATLIMRASLPLSTPYVAPNSEVEALAATTFAEVFNLDKVGIDDEFFELGGDSLLAEVLSLALSERTNVPLQPSAFVEAASPREIARLFNGTEVAPGWLDIARYANSSWAKEPILQAWRTVLRHLPDVAPTPFTDDRDKDVQVVPAGATARPGGAPIIFVFCGHGQRFAIPLNMLHRWLGALGAHVVYLRDFRKVFYLSGVTSLGTDYASTIDGFRRIARDLGASTIHTMGNSGGVLGAVQMGLDLGAQSVLCLAGNLGLIPRLRRRVADEFPNSKSFDPAMLDLRYRYESSSVYPRIRLIYGDGHKLDRSEAARFKGLEGVELLPLVGWKEHLVIDDLIGKNEFVPTLEWMLNAKAVSRGEGAPTPLGKAGPLPVSSKTRQVFRAMRRDWRRDRLTSRLKALLGIKTKHKINMK